MSHTTPKDQTIPHRAAPPAVRRADIVREALPQLGAVTPVQRFALHAIANCRTGAFGARVLHCDGCRQSLVSPRSCGHRSCPRCQHQAASDWLDRQQRKLLPVDYYMATFTLPEGMRTLARQQPTQVYNAMFAAAAQTLSTFGRNDRKLRASLGFCAVLHTHSRRLDYHPHLHVVMPGGGVDVKRRQWRTRSGNYLFNGRQLANVFRTKLIHALKGAGLNLPRGLPARWIVHCDRVGSGLPALTYLSRYLYRGVIQEQQIVAVDQAARTVTFSYQDGKTKQTALRTLPVVAFVQLILQHVLPKGFRRARDYGFLHHNARRLIDLLHYVLQVVIQAAIVPVLRPFLCPHCQQPMHVIGATPRAAVT